MLSFAGFREAVTFKYITESDIDYVQNFISHKLPAIFDEIDSRTDSGVIPRLHFFGQMDFNNPSEFEFSRGERQIIMDMAEYVKDTVDLEGKNSGLHHFIFC